MEGVKPTSKRGVPMQQSNQRLDSFISEATSGEASAIPADEELGGERIWSGQIAEIDERTWHFYREEHSGPPKMMQDEWFIFSDARLVEEPGILFWQKGEQYFARRLDQGEWDKFLKAAKVKKKFW
jgi:hypothetical protein